jgi:hypothetical protein
MAKAARMTSRVIKISRVTYPTSQSVRRMSSVRAEAVIAKKSRHESSPYEFTS